MRRVIFSGTSEGKTLCRQLSQAGLSAEVCVATEYGKEVMPELRGITVHTGRMTAPEMTEFLCGAQVVIDATHPYAVEVSKNIRAACAQVSCRYIRLLRPKTQAEGAVHVPSAEAAARIAPGERPLALAMLLHDIGKPERFALDGSGEGHFYGHAQVSADIADSVLRRLRTSTALREQVCEIVRYHDIPLPENDRQFRRMLSKHGEELSRDIAMAHIADDMAKKPECLPRCEDWRRLISRIPEMAQESCLSVKSLAVDGGALSGIVPPSPLMGEVLKFLLDGVVDGKFPNEREFLLQEAAKYIANRQKT